MCDTPEAKDRCNPRCVVGKGACDEGGLCESNTGPDCDYSSAENKNLYVLLVLVLLASIASFAFM